MEDARKAALRKGLAQLNNEQIKWLLEVDPANLVTDEYYYHEGRY